MEVKSTHYVIDPVLIYIFSSILMSNYLTNGLYFFINNHNAALKNINIETLELESVSL